MKIFVGIPGLIGASIKAALGALYDTNQTHLTAEVVIIEELQLQQYYNQDQQFVLITDNEINDLPENVKYFALRTLDSVYEHLQALEAQKQ